MVKTFSDFITDYNHYYQCKFKELHLNDADLEEVIFDLYDTENCRRNYEAIKELEVVRWKNL